MALKDGTVAPYRVRAGYLVVRCHMESARGGLPRIQIRAFGPFIRMVDAQLYLGKQDKMLSGVEWAIIDLEAAS